MRRLRGDDGQALVAGVAASLVVLTVIVMMLGLAEHANDQTVRDRSRTQGLQSAEAALSYAIDGLSRRICVPDAGMQAPVSLTVGGRVVGQYRVMVRLPSEAGVASPVLWNPNDTSGPGCTTRPPESGLRTITAWGYGPSAGSLRRALRKVEVNVLVAPLAGFRFACFAGGNPPGGLMEVKNNMVVNGDCYARAVSSSFNNLVENGVLMSPGAITTKNNAVYQGSIWGGQQVTVGNNTTVTGNVTSALSSVTLSQNARVLGNVTAGTTITLQNGAAVDGTRCPASPSDPGCPTSPPPALSLPTLRCSPSDAACWASLYPGMDTTKTASQLSSWLSANRSALAGSFFVNDPAGTVDFTGGGTITGPLTIITTGKIALSRDLATPSATTPPAACTAGGARTCQVVLVSLSTASDAIRVRPPRFTANTATISVLLYTTGSILAEGGANPITYSGSVYGSGLTIDSNGMTITTSQDLIAYPPPFVNWSAASSLRFSVQPLAWRELPPAEP